MAGQQMTDQQLRKKFKELDTDNSGFLERDELLIGVRQVNADISDAEVDEYIAKVDKNADGKISYEEFVELVKLRKL
jgi:Ca2+-binding EF-hand superfamily protein